MPQAKTVRYEDQWVEVTADQAQHEVHEVWISDEVVHVLVRLQPPPAPRAPSPMAGVELAACGLCGHAGHQALRCSRSRHPQVLGAFRRVLASLAPLLRDGHDADRTYTGAVLNLQGGAACSG